MYMNLNRTGTKKNSSRVLTEDSSENLMKKRETSYLPERAVEEMKTVRLNRLITLLMNEHYHQCDETTWNVIMDGRPAGSKSFIWIHTTSELCECNPIIIFAYERTHTS